MPPAGRPVRGMAGAPSCPLALAQSLQRQVVRHQFLQRQAQLGRMPPLPQQFLGGVGRRRVQVLERAGQVVGMLPRGQQVLWRLPLQAGQGLAAKIAPLVLADAVGSGVNGCKRLLDRVLPALEGAVFRVEHLQAAAAAAHLAEAAQPGTRFEAVLLGRGEMEEAQGQGTAAILDARHQAAAPSEYDVGGAHLTFHHHVGTLPRRGDGGHPGAILVAQRQVEQQILDLVDAVVREPGREPGPHSAQLAHRYARSPCQKWLVLRVDGESSGAGLRIV